MGSVEGIVEHVSLILGMVSNLIFQLYKVAHEFKKLPHKKHHFHGKVVA